MKMYRIEIWRYHGIVDVYTSNNIKKVLTWYKRIGKIVMTMAVVRFIYTNMTMRFHLKIVMNWDFMIKGKW